MPNKLHSDFYKKHDNALKAKHLFYIRQLKSTKVVLFVIGVKIEMALPLFIADSLNKICGPLSTYPVKALA
jgi:hypothetical protein